MNRDSIDFEHEPIAKLFKKLLIPTLFGTLAISAVTAIDGIFVGHGVGVEGVAAVNIVVPIYQIMSGIGLMMGVGCSVVASVHLSRKNLKAARLNITQSIITASLFAILLYLITTIFSKQTYLLLGASETLIPQVSAYMKWIMPSFLFEMWSVIGLFIIRLDGSPRYAMWCNIVPAALNVVLDWLFIFPLSMGVEGAAIATLISIITGGIMALCHILFFARNLHFARLKISKKSILLTIRNIGYQCKIGISTLLGELTLAVLILVGNLVFMKYLGDVGVGAFGIACYYAPFFFMIGNAVAQSAQPIISYNYGINCWNRVKETRRLLLRTAIVFGIIVATLFICTPDILVSLFIDSQSEAGRIASNGFPYFATGIVFFILNVAIVGYFQSVEQAKNAAIYMLLRGFLLLIPIFYLLPAILGVKGIWLAMPATELLTFIIILLHWRIKQL